MPDFRNMGLNSRQKGKISQYINKYNYAVCKNKAIKLFNEFYDKKNLPPLLLQIFAPAKVRV